MISRNKIDKILHIDGDAFFANCEKAANPKLADKPVVVGKERGVATAPCYQAKRAGIERGTMINEVKNICPEAVTLEGNYSRYKIYSQRMYDIFNEYGDIVEEYSIDESFIGMAGIPTYSSYKKLAEEIQQEVKRKLSILVSIGIAPSKTLAKIASDWNKPRGICQIKENKIDKFLENFPLDELWGIASNLKEKLNKYGIQTALELKQARKTKIAENFSINILRTYQELKGKYVIPLKEGHIAKHKSKGSSKTFSPPTKDKNKLFSYLSRNIEKACKRLRKFNFISKEMSIFIKRNDYEGGYSKYKRSIELDIASAHPSYIIPRIKETFAKIFRPNQEYRATGCYFYNLRQATPAQLGLLDNYLEQQEKAKVYEAVDEIEDKFGKNSIFLASSLEARDNLENEQGAKVGKNKRLDIPKMGKIK
jgi:DNA polymerase-4/DNA polymerase V